MDAGILKLLFPAEYLLPGGVSVVFGISDQCTYNRSECMHTYMHNNTNDHYVPAEVWQGC